MPPTEIVPPLFRFLRAFALFGSWFAIAALSILTLRAAFVMVSRREWWRWGYILFFASAANLMVQLASLIADTVGLPPSGDVIRYLFSAFGMTVGGAWIVWNESHHGRAP